MVRGLVLANEASSARTRGCRVDDSGDTAREAKRFQRGGAYTNTEMRVRVRRPGQEIRQEEAESLPRQRSRADGRHIRAAALAAPCSP